MYFIFYDQKKVERSRTERLQDQKDATPHCTSQEGSPSICTTPHGTESPDLNSIENIWDHLKSTVQVKNPKNAKELWTSVKDAWNEFPRERLLNLIDSMPNRFKAVIKASGGHTRY